jgi:hypothetical protein
MIKGWYTKKRKPIVSLKHNEWIIKVVWDSKGIVSFRLEYNITLYYFALIINSVISYLS